MEPDDEDLGEVQISIEPHDEQLAAMGVSPEEFEAALDRALDAYHELAETTEDPDDVPSLDEMPVELGGKSYLLGDIAEIEIVGKIPEE